MKRRDVIIGSAGLGLGLVALQRFARGDSMVTPGSRDLAGMTLVPGEILDLAPGFRARVIQRSGDLMADGFTVPSRPASMACFETAETLMLMRNHEVGVDDHGGGPFSRGQKLSEEMVYSPRGAGGVTRIVIDKKTLQPISSNLILAGTVRNCSGGINPFGWFSCEETTLVGHGYVFHCAVDRDTVQKPLRLPLLGRMNHEAAVAHPQSGVVYMTEDREDGLFYRFVPSGSPDRDGPESLWSAGRLQVLSVDGLEGESLNALPPMEKRTIQWVDVDRPHGEADTLRMLGRQRGGTLVQRGEGLWLDGDRVVFTATSGGRRRLGQIVEIRLSVSAEDSLKVLVEGDARVPLVYPDNLCTAPDGSLFVAEDGGGRCRILHVSGAGDIRVLAQNPRSGREIAGVCYSPSTQSLFCNLQKEGLTVLIEGPFSSLFG